MDARYTFSSSRAEHYSLPALLMSDHLGVSNIILINEKHPLSFKYKNKSIAEQNSVELAWDLLMNPSNEKLRSCICSTGEEFNRFRSLVVNSVMATDIVSDCLHRVPSSMI
jgi:3'5'-cyclic nucleotide phosphodiesterase